MIGAELTGSRFGRLVVTAQLESVRRPKGACRMWQCLCDCGQVTKISTGQLTSGKTRSCGCLRRENSSRYCQKPSGVAGRNSAIVSYKKGARSRQLEWRITDEDAFKMFSENCYYCGAPPQNISKAPGGDFIYTGIDRMDNALGYIPGNVVPCCKACNFIKCKLSTSEILAWAKTVTRVAELRSIYGSLS